MQQPDHKCITPTDIGGGIGSKKGKLGENSGQNQGSFANFTGATEN